MIKILWKNVNIITTSIFFFLLLNINPVKADSPLTSTDLISGYEDLPMIVKLKQTKIINEEISTFLLSNISLDKKAAVINALGWNFDGQNNGYLFLQALVRKRGLREIENLQLQDLTPDNKFVLGYLLAMGDYLTLSGLQPNSPQSLLRVTPLELLSQAAFALPDNFTVHFIKSLIEAQLHFHHSWCAVYLSPQDVLQRFPEQKRNLHPLAVKKAMEYMNLYRDNCFGLE